MAKITKKIDKVSKLALTKQKEGWFSGASGLKTLFGPQFLKDYFRHFSVIYETMFLALHNSYTQL